MINLVSMFLCFFAANLNAKKYAKDVASTSFYTVLVYCVEMSRNG